MRSWMRHVRVSCDAVSAFFAIFLRLLRLFCYCILRLFCYCDLSFVWRVRVSFEVFLCFVRIRRSNCSTVPGSVDVYSLGHWSGNCIGYSGENGPQPEPDYLFRWIDWQILARRSLSIIQRRPDRLSAHPRQQFFRIQCRQWRC